MKDKIALLSIGLVAGYYMTKGLKVVLVLAALVISFIAGVLLSDVSIRF